MDTESSASQKHSGTRERIFQAATKLFAEQGFENTSMKQICSLANANISAVNYHFKTKDSLYRMILQSFFDEGRQMAQNLLIPCENLEEFKIRLKIFVEELTKKCLKDLESILLILREVELLRDQTKDIFQEIMEDKKLENFLLEAQKKGFIKAEIDVNIFADMIMGHIFHAIRFNRFEETYSENSLFDPVYRKKWIDQVLFVFFTSVLGEPG